MKLGAPPKRSRRWRRMLSNSCRARSPCTGSEYRTPTVGFRTGLACRIGPRSFTIFITASSCDWATAKGALFTVAMRWPVRAQTEIRSGGDDDAGHAVDLPQQFVVDQHAAVFGGKELARPPAASRISRHPHPISCAAWLTASSSPTSPSSSSVTQTCAKSLGFEQPARLLRSGRALSQ